MDYFDLMQPIAEAVKRLTGCPVNMTPSDRLPSYSDRTCDIEVLVGEKWLEVASISKRHDVPFEWSVQKPSAGVPVHVVTSSKKLINYEFAFGLDRLVHAMRAN